MDDQFEFAESILSKHCAASPFHAVGYALMAYVEAMLGFEVEKIQLAASRIASAEELVRQWGKRIRKQRTWRSRWYRRQQEEDDDDEEEEEEEEEDESLSKRRQSSSSSSNGSFEPVSISFFSDSSTASSSSSTTAAAEKEWSSSSSSSPVEGTTMDLQCDLLQVNCMLMSATIQFLRNSWLDYMKAAYRLRKAYKMYEQLFEAITGQKMGDYAAMLRRKRAKRLPRKFGTASSWTERRFSLFNLSSSARKASLDNIRASFGGTPSRSSFSLYEDRSHHHRTTDSTVESGVCFGIGLFSLIFSLLPPKGNANNAQSEVKGDHWWFFPACSSKQDIEYSGIPFLAAVCASCATAILRKSGSLLVLECSDLAYLLHQSITVYPSPPFAKLS